MSRLSNRRIELRFGDGGLSARLSSRWPRAAVLGRVAREFDPAAVAVPAGDGEQDDAIASRWTAAVDGALSELAAIASIRGAVLDAVLADVLVHFDIAHGEFGGLGDQRLEALARACIQELLDEAVQGHELRWQLQADERHLFVCAVPSALLGSLRDAAARHGLRLGRVQPSFQIHWNRHGGLLRSALGVFASGDDSHVLIAMVRNGVVEALGSGRWCEADNSAAPRIDSDVGRLIAGLGVDPASLRHFIAVDGRREGGALPPRWTTLRSGEVAA